MIPFSDSDSTHDPTLPGAIALAIAREQEQRAERRLQAERLESEHRRQEQQQAKAERERIVDIVRDVMADELPDALEALGVL